MRSLWQWCSKRQSCSRDWVNHASNTLYSSRATPSATQLCHSTIALLRAHDMLVLRTSRYGMLHASILTELLLSNLSIGSRKWLNQMYQDFVNTSWFDQCEYSNQTGISRRFFWYPPFERATKMDEMVVSFVSTFHLLQHCKEGWMVIANKIKN